MLNRWNFLKTGFYEGIKLPSKYELAEPVGDDNISEAFSGRLQRYLDARTDTASSLFEGVVDKVKSRGAIKIRTGADSALQVLIHGLSPQRVAPLIVEVEVGNHPKTISREKLLQPNTAIFGGAVPTAYSTQEDLGNSLRAQRGSWCGWVRHLQLRSHEGRAPAMDRGSAVPVERVRQPEVSGGTTMKEGPPRIQPKSLSDYLEVMSQTVFWAGISWRVVESKWSSIRDAFQGFDPVIVANLSPDDIDRAGLRQTGHSPAAASSSLSSKTLAECWNWRSASGSFHNYLSSHDETSKSRGRCTGSFQVSRSDERVPVPVFGRGH